MAHSHADSAGQPWAGRHFDANRFSGDSGEAPERLIEALRDFREGGIAKSAVLDALRDARLLVPLVAHAGETGVDEHGRTIDKTQELSLVTVEGPDGRTVLPAFSSTVAMAAWKSDARPIPVDGRRVALAAAAEGTPIVVLDPTSETEFVLRRAMIRAVAEGTDWTPAWDDENVLRAVTAATAEFTEIRSVALVDGDPTASLAGPEVVVVLGLVPGLDQGAISSILAGVQSGWQASELIAERIDSLAVKLVAAG